MRKLTRNALVAGAVAAVTVGLTGTPAFATGGYNWDVEPAGPFYASSDDTVLTNNGVALTCDLAEAEGDVYDDTSTDPDHVGTITNTTWTNCSGGGISFTVSHSGDWELYADSEDSNHVVSGHLENVKASISGFLCNATFEGTVRGTYDNAGTLTIDEPANGGLVATSVSGCFGIISTGNKPSFYGNFTVEDPSNLTIHSTSE